MSASEVRAAVEQAFRDYNTDGVPSSGDHEPAKPEIRRALGALLERALADALGGVIRYATVAAMNANVAAVDGQLAYVYRNNGVSTDPANGYYQSVAGVWARATWFESNLSPTLLAIVSASTGANQFDKDNLLAGQEIYYTDGSVSVYPTSTVSNTIYVRTWEAVTISGLPANPVFDRYYAWLAADGVTVVDFGFFPGASAGATIEKPDDAWFFHFDVWKRNDAPGSLAAIQVERGFTASAYTAFLDDLIVGFDGRVLNVEPVIFGTVGSKNLFNKATVVEGKEVYGDGSLNPEPQSSYSLPIYVGDLVGRSIHLSGLQIGPFSHYYNFHTSDEIEPATWISGGFVNQPDSAITVTVPIGAEYFIFSPRQRDPAPGDYDDVQLEAGTTRTDYQAYTPRIVSINGMQIGTEGADDVTAGGIGLGFGDSITETTNVNAGSYLYPDGYRQNWPDVAVPKIRPDQYYSYAKSGAHIIDWAVADGDFQKLSKQVDTAIAAGHNARWLVVAAGTNDIGNGAPLGDYATAMAKPLRIAPDGTVTTTLTSTIVLEAFRRELFRLNWKFPNARKFYVTPLQRADISPDAMSAAVDALARMARRYGFEVIDAFNESGILAELEATDFTGSIAGNTLTVTAVAGSIPLKVGQQVRGAGVFTTTITALGTGTGGNGTYTVGDAQAVSSRTMQAAGGNKTYDGLHTYTQGWQDQGTLIAARVMPRLG